MAKSSSRYFDQPDRFICLDPWVHPYLPFSFGTPDHSDAQISGLDVELHDHLDIVTPYYFVIFLDFPRSTQKSLKLQLSWFIQVDKSDLLHVYSVILSVHFRYSADMMVWADALHWFGTEFGIITVTVMSVNITRTLVDQNMHRSKVSVLYQAWYRYYPVSDWFIPKVCW